MACPKAGNRELLKTCARAGVGILLMVAPLILSPRPAPAACWTPGELAGTAGELALVKGAQAKRYASQPRPPLPSDHGSPLPADLVGLITSVAVPRGQKPVALTFDLCEGPGELAGYDGGIVDTLRKRGAAATFFAGGKWLHNHPLRAMQLISDPLFEVGNHGYLHADLTAATEAQAEREILGAQSEYRAVRENYLALACSTPEEAQRIPELPRVFRLPYGRPSPVALATASSLGLATIQWDVAPGDPSPGLSAGALSAEVLRRVRPGSIIVLHANAKGCHTAEALGVLLDGLASRGYNLVTVSELLSLGEPVRERKKK